MTLKDLDFDATGSYYCEVSIDNPIFTKASSEVHLHVIGEWAREFLEWIENKKFIWPDSEAEHSAENILQEEAVRRGRELDSQLYDRQSEASSPHHLVN